LAGIETGTLEKRGYAALPHRTAMQRTERGSVA